MKVTRPARPRSFSSAKRLSMRALVVFVLTLVMCGISGLLALRKVRKLDPAEVF